MCQALSLEFGEQEVDPALDDDGEVVTRIGVAHEVTTELELVAKCSACREFDAETLRAERVDARARDSRWHVRSWKAGSQQGLDFTFALLGGQLE